MSGHKIGEVHARAMLHLGLVELRNAASFDNSNIQDDVRRSIYDVRQEMNQPPQAQQAPVLELEQDR